MHYYSMLMRITQSLLCFELLVFILSFSYCEKKITALWKLLFSPKVDLGVGVRLKSPFLYQQISQLHPPHIYIIFNAACPFVFRMTHIIQRVSANDNEK